MSKRVQFRTSVDKFALRYRGIVAGEKLQHIRQSSGQHADKQEPTVLKTYPVNDLARQLLTVMPTFLDDRTVHTAGALSAVGAARYRTMYLLWLSQHSLADLWVINGAHYWDGRLRINELPAQHAPLVAALGLSRQTLKPHSRAKRPVITAASRPIELPGRTYPRV
jgi:hypothetical protein